MLLWTVPSGERPLGTLRGIAVGLDTTTEGRDVSWIVRGRGAVRAVQLPGRAKTYWSRLTSESADLRVLRALRHRFPAQHHIVARPILCGLHHEYGLEKVAA
jgi:hypothetical protein